MAKRNTPPKSKHLKVSDQVRRLVGSCGVSRYRLAQSSGLSESTLSFFMSGERRLSGKALDRLGETLDLRVVMGRDGVGAGDTNRKTR
jgi:transcriptional regulator with XRE-family HTH domain